MHYNDIIYVLAFVLVNPLTSAAPIFPNSNDIDENGYFIPGGQGRPVPGFSGPKDRRDLIGTIEGGVNSALSGVEQAVSGVLQKKDLKDDINGAIDDANGAFGTIAGDVDPKFNPPDIPHLPKRDIVGSIEGFANGAINDVESAVNGIFNRRDTSDSLHLTLDEIRQMQAASAQQSKRGLDERDIIGSIEGTVNGAINSVESAVNGILNRRDGPDSLHLTLDEIRTMQAAGAAEQSKRSLNERDLVGTLGGFATNVVQNVQTLVGDILPQPPQKRDLVGDLNGVIGTANQDISQIAGDVDPNVHIPAIPNIPTKRGVLPGPFPSEFPHFPGVEMGPGPVVDPMPEGPEPAGLQDMP